ncbi:DHS-like NAD/FAD-binding domain-containing protein [Xylariaceae sp. FL0804]|nr:DHS-like NAD/FAD-binding domain-containing protein [Xylariaceae sp. FL0804]
MASSTSGAGSGPPSDSVDAFRALLGRSERVLALCGAGLSAASGLPTFRGAGGLWRQRAATDLATPEAFRADPGLVSLFYAWRKHAALRARPNRGHRALAELARRRGEEGFLCLTQNVDGLSTRAGHPASQLRQLHGSILDVKCFAAGCGYVQRNNTDDPMCPALAPACEDPQDAPPGQTTPTMPMIPLLDPDVPAPRIAERDLPHCPRCRVGLLRPGVVWFGEGLDPAMLAEVDDWIDGDGDGDGATTIDLMLVVGTAAAVYPAAGYTRRAQRRGARVAVVNPDPDSASGMGLTGRDFFFRGSADELLPRLFEGVIGEMDEDGNIV